MTDSLPIRLKNRLIEHCARYPHLQAQDVYKFLYQAAMGNGHAFTDSSRARTCLGTEIIRLIPDASQPLVEQISPESRLERKVVRVHLRPYLALTNNIDPLLEAFVRTADEIVGSNRRLEQYGSLICQIPDRPDLHFLIDNFERFMAEMRTRDYPSIHHSHIYSRHYQPAYRVVAVNLMIPILDICREIG